MNQNHIRGFTALAGAGLASIAVSAAPAEDVVIDFEDVAIAAGTVQDAAPQIISREFIFDSVQFLALQNDGMPLIGSNGTTTLHSLVTPVIVTHAEGELFSLKSVDLGEGTNALFTARTINVTGFVDGGLPVIASLDLDMIFDGAGNLDDLQTFTFDDQWANLTSVQFVASSTGFDSNFVMDNLVAGLPDTDSDGDGVPDGDDNCPESDLRTTIWIGDVDTGVGNQLLEDGCTMADVLAGCGGEDVRLGWMLSCVVGSAEGWKDDGLISGRDFARIVTSAIGQRHNSRAAVRPRGPRGARGRFGIGRR